MKLFKTAFLANWVVLSAHICFAGMPEDQGKQRSVTVQGQGKIQAVPDIAMFSIEVMLEGDALDTLSTQARERMQKALSILKAQGIEEKDIQTEVYHVQPRFEYDKAGNAKRKGFSVTHRLLAKVRDLKKVGSVLSAVLASGVTTVNGPNFGFDHPELLERQALAKAVEDAKAKADILAHAAGATLGDVQTIAQENTGPVAAPRPFLMARAMAVTDGESAQEPIAAGEDTFTAGVTAVFSLR